MARQLYPLLCALILLASWVVYATGYLNVDSAWLLLLSQKVFDGAVLYRDVHETNPPLIVWLHMPATWLAQHTLLTLHHAWVLQVLVFTAIALRRLARISILPTGMLYCAAFAVTVFAGVQFAQREHIAMLLMLPFLLQLIYGGKSPALDVLLASIGALIKPYYLLLPLTLMLWQGVRSRMFFRSLFGATNWLFAVPVLLYAAWLWHDGRWLEQLPELLQHYHGYNVPIEKRWLLYGIIPAIGFSPWVAWLCCGSFVRKASPQIQAFALLAAAAMFSVWLQNKGFSNHIRFMSMAFVLLAGAVLVSLVRVQERFMQKLAFMIAASVVLLSAVVTLREWPAIYAQHFPEHRMPDQQAADYRAADSVFTLGFGIPSAMSVAAKHGQEVTSPLQHLWYLPAVYQHTIDGHGATPVYHPPHQMPAFEKQMFDHTVQAFVASEPAWVIVEKQDSYYHPVHGAFRFDFLRYFSQSPQFAAALRAYQQAGKNAQYHFYRKDR